MISTEYFLNTSIPKLLIIKSFLFFILVHNGTAQSQVDNTKGRFHPTAGLTFRTTAMNAFNFNGVRPSDITRPYSYEKNIQGLSLNIGFQFNLTNKIAVEYYPNLRYDEIYSVTNSKEFTGTIGPNGDSAFVSTDHSYIKSFLIDHNFNLIYRNKISYGIGVTIINHNKSYEFINPIPRTHDIQFTSYNALVNFELMENTKLEVKILYAPSGFPYNEDLSVMMYSLRLYYLFDFY